MPDHADERLERRGWTLAYSMLLVPVSVLSMLAIVAFDGPGTSYARWLFVGDVLAAASIGSIGVLIYGFACTRALRHVRFTRTREWVSWHLTSCALLYLVVVVAAVTVARTGEDRGRAAGLIALAGAAAAWGIFLNAAVTTFTVAFRREVGSTE